MTTDTSALSWPELPPYAAWQDTCITLQLWTQKLWTQIVGKVRLVFVADGGFLVLAWSDLFVKGQTGLPCQLPVSE